MGKLVVSRVFSETVRPNATKTSGRIAIIHSNLHGDRDTMNASSLYSIPHTARRTHFIAVSGSALASCS